MLDDTDDDFEPVAEQAAWPEYAGAVLMIVSGITGLVAAGLRSARVALEPSIHIMSWTFMGFLIGGVILLFAGRSLIARLAGVLGALLGLCGVFAYLLLIGPPFSTVVSFGLGKPPWGTDPDFSWVHRNPLHASHQSAWLTFAVLTALGVIGLAAAASRTQRLVVDDDEDECDEPPQFQHHGPPPPPYQAYPPAPYPQQPPQFQSPPHQPPDNPWGRQA